jgi:PAS domain S-box-containing protein
MKKSSTSENLNKTEIALKKSEERYRTTMMSVGDGVISTNTEGKVEMMNPVAEVLTGWKQEKALGKSLEEIFRIINEETRQAVENPVRRVMHEGIVVGLANHTILLAKDGKEHPIADSGAPIRNEKGEITGVVLVFRDQTQERMAQKALQESECKFRETVTYLDEGYYSVTIEGLLLDHNQSFIRILGFDIGQDMTGIKLPDFWQDPEDRKQYLNELKAHGFIRNYLVNAKKKNGEKIVVLMNSHLVKDEKGGLIRIEGTFTDFTRMMLIEQALKESEAKYKALFENAQVGMYRSKIDGSGMLDVNKKFGEILGLTREEALGKAGRILWANPEDRDKMMSLLKEQGGVLNNYEARLIDRKGEVRDVLASIELHRAEGSLDGTFVDITERKRAEEQLRKLNRIYSLLSDINQAIVRTRVPEELFKQVCNIAVEQGGFGMAWIGLLEESSQQLRVIAQAGSTNGYLEQIDISLNGEPMGYCPIDSVLRQGKHFTCNINENEEMASCQKIAFELGFRSSASFPLKVSDILRGTLNFYSYEPDFFDEKELKLLDELAMDISFAMEYAEKEAASKLVEKSLRESEEKFRGVFESNILGTLFWNANGDIIAANDAFLEIVGYSREDLTNGALKWKELTPSTYDKIDEEKLKELANRGKIDAFEKEYIHKSGRLIPIIISAATLSGSETSGVAIILDITQRKKVEEALITSEERFRTASGSLTDVVYEWDMKDKVDWYGDIDGIMGYPSGEFPRTMEGWAATIHPEDKEGVMTVLKSHLKGAAPYLVDYRVGRKNGEWRWWSARGTALRNDRGEPYKMIGSITDITVRKLAEEALLDANANLELRILERTIELERSKQLLEETGRLARVGGWEIDIKNNILYWSETTLKIHEVDSGFVPDLKTAINFYAPEAVPVISQCVDKAIRLGEPFDVELELITAKKNRLWVRAIGEAYRENGEILKIGGVFQDINERKLIEQEREVLIKQIEHRSSLLESSYKELEAFSYSVSHDLRAPLRHVSGYVELLNKHFRADLPEKGQHYLSSIADSVRIMGMLIDDLLQFSKTGRMEMRQSDCDMNEIVKEVIESLCKDNPDRKIEWVRGKLSSVYGDEAMLRLVWMNLLSNAVKFTRTRRKASIEIGARKEKNEQVFFVRDNGVGFDMQYAQKLFGVFQRLHPSEEFEGTGIGLANVHRIVLRHGGRTWAKAETDKGAEFNFSIPINQEEK